MSDLSPKVGVLFETGVAERQTTLPANLKRHGIAFPAKITLSPTVHVVTATILLVPSALATGLDKSMPRAFPSVTTSTSHRVGYPTLTVVAQMKFFEIVFVNFRIDGCLGQV